MPKINTGHRIEFSYIDVDTTFDFTKKKHHWNHLKMETKRNKSIERQKKRNKAIRRELRHARMDARRWSEYYQKLEIARARVRHWNRHPLINWTTKLYNFRKKLGTKQTNGNGERIYVEVLSESEHAHYFDKGTDGYGNKPGDSNKIVPTSAKALRLQYPGGQVIYRSEVRTQKKTDYVKKSYSKVKSKGREKWSKDVTRRLKQ